MQTNSISANREVILAAGAQRTPQVLQLSGIGSSDLLQKYNVPVVVDLPGVGANFHDHPMVFVIGAYGNDLNPSPSNATNTTWLAEQKTLYDTKREGTFKLGITQAGFQLIYVM
jgi:choline dehydrogenase